MESVMGVGRIGPMNGVPLAGGESLPGGDGPWALAGAGTIWTCTIATIVLFVVAIALVPGWTRRRVRLWPGVLVQGVAVLLCAALAMASLGLWLNRSYQFYGSWADLLDPNGNQLVGSQSGPVDEPPSAGQLAALARARIAPVPARLTDPSAPGSGLPGIQRTEQGQYLQVRIPGRASGMTQSALVRLPPGYMSPANSHRRYPVILAFSGIPGTPAAWERGFGLSQRLDSLASQGRLADAIVVLPIVYPGKLDTECVDPSAGKHPTRGRHATAKPTRYETWIATDAVGWTKQHLRTIEDPHAWATMGYSAGGWCASMLSVRHPDVARYSISLGGYFDVDYSPGQVWTERGDPKYDLPRIAADERPDVSMYFFAGGDDKLCLPSLHKMERAVSGPTSLTVQLTERGGHLVTLWSSHLPNALEWLGRTSPGFDPSVRP